MSRCPRLLPLICVALALALPAAAHDGFHPETVRLLLKPDGLYLSVLLAWPAGRRARRARAGWDTDRDGRIDPAEQRAALEVLARRATGELVVELDGARRRPAADGAPAAVGLLGSANSAEPCSVSFRLDLAFYPRPGRHRLVVRDAPAVGGSHVPAFFQPGRGVELLGHNGLASRRGPLVMVSGLLTAADGLAVEFRFSAVADGPAARSAR